MSLKATLIERLNYDVLKNAGILKFIRKGI